jgi:hypothetical protein
MENKVNIAEILKDCPSGMKLNCLMYEDVYFDYVKHNIIHCYIQLETHKSFIMFNQHGTINSNIKSKCVIFPPGKTTWEGFIPPCKFNDGDIISNGRCICIYNGNNDNNYYGFYVGLGNIDFPNYFIDTPQNSYFTKEDTHLATEEEKQKLFDAIKENGYHWNEETKNLEKLIVPKFKVGDRVRHKTTRKQITITKIHQDCYEYGGRYILTFENQDEYELVPNKFDINTLVPFESKVLIRNTLCGHWEPAFWGAYTIDHSDGLLQHHDYLTTKGFTNYCIPYEGNEHLMGKTDDCIEYYKTW